MNKRFCHPCISDIKSCVKKDITPTQIIKSGCYYLGLDRRTVLSDIREKKFKDCRQMLMKIIYESRKISSKEVGQMFGGRDHTTVLHANKVVADLCDTEEVYNSRFHALRHYVLNRNCD